MVIYNEIILAKRLLGFEKPFQFLFNFIELHLEKLHPRFPVFGKLARLRRYSFESVLSRRLSARKEEN